MARAFAATYQATAQSVAVVRNQMAALAADCGLDEHRIADVKLAVSEAATNALLHAYPQGDPTGVIHVEAEIACGELTITVLDEGQGMRPRADSPGLGLGLPVIATLAGRLEIGPGNGGTSLKMAFECPETEPAGARA